MIPLLLAGAGALVATKVIEGLLSQDDDAPSHRCGSSSGVDVAAREQRQLDFQLQQQAMRETRELLERLVSGRFEERSVLISQLCLRLDAAIEQSCDEAIKGILQLLSQVQQQHPVPEMAQLLSKHQSLLGVSLSDLPEKRLLVH